MNIITLKNGKTVFIRPYEKSDFNKIQHLNEKEGWSNLVQRGEDTKKAWENSDVSFVLVSEEGVIGYVRGLTDQQITLYICEILIEERFRKLGLGKKLLEYVHQLYPTTRMELLASSTSKTYYEDLGLRAYYGFRKTIDE